MDLAPFEGGGGWGVLAVLAAFTVGPYALFSKDNSEKWWALGRFSRWIKNRKIREIKESSHLAEVTMQAHAEDRKRWATQMQEMRDEFAEDRDRWRETERRLRADLLEAFDYIDYLVEWILGARSSHSENGWEPDLQEWLSFSEWKKRR